MTQDTSRGVNGLMSLAAVVGAGVAFGKWQGSSAAGWAFALALMLVSPSSSIVVRFYRSKDHPEGQPFKGDA